MATLGLKTAVTRFAQIGIISAILYYIVVTNRIIESAWGILYIFLITSSIATALLSSVFICLFTQALYKPRGYTSLKATEYGIEFQFRPSREVEIIKWENIESINFDRSISMDSDDEYWTEWIIRTDAERFITIVGEPHSARIIFISVAKRLVGFRRWTAIRAILSKKRGRWICYEVKAIA